MSDAATAVKRVLRIATGVMVTSESMTTAGLSTIMERTSAGIGTTTPDQTVSDRPDAEPARRASALPIAQASAASSVTTSGSQGAVVLWPTMTTASPTMPTMIPKDCRVVGRSRSSNADTITDSTTCVCRRSDASPAGIPSARAR